MNVLLVDSDCCGCHMAYLAAESEHQVKWWMPREKGKAIRDGDGFPGIEKVGNWQEHMQWARKGIVINLFNDKKICGQLDQYKSFGFPIFGPSAKSASLEHLRAKGMTALQKIGVQVPHWEQFNSLEDALKYAKKTDERLVFKTLGDEEDKSLSYVSSGSEDMVWRIQSWIRQGLVLKGPCMLQQFVDGIEVGVSAWMGKSGFISPWNVNFEFKKLMADDYGPATGEMGTVCKYVEHSELGDQVLKPCEDLLQELGHIGDVDLNCIVDDKGQPWVLEWTTRFGWPSTQILMQCHKGDAIAWMKDAINGKAALKVDDRTAIGVLMAAPPFPYPDEEGQANDLLVSGIEDEWQNVAPWQVRLEKDQYLTTGAYVCVATALASDVHDAIPQVYETCKRIKFPNRIVRSDIGKRLEAQLPKLKSLGYEEMPEW